MAKLSVISYNCKGFNVSKVPCIKILLDRCSVLLLQETWLFSNQFTQFTKYFDKYKSINICEMDESIFGMVGPMVVVPYCIVITDGKK